ncbi:hypothetical protein Cni_G02393 [Canna indica]|uniref:Uncharacterized protein n=1 Tax=Canna indica TaxID=4628 RepID=A0AAQ3JPD2_9LILI|nr:hypothetical protein Cni_G02393 [Canna indica]
MQEKAQKSGVFLGSSVSGAHCLLLHNHIRALISGVLFQPWMSHARMCTLSPLVSCNLRKPPTRLFATASYVLSSPTVSASVAAAAVAASPVSSRIGILSWYLVPDYQKFILIFQPSSITAIIVATIPHLRTLSPACDYALPPAVVRHRSHSTKLVIMESWSKPCIT